MKKLTIFFLIFSFLFSTVVMAQSEITPPKKTQKTTVAKTKPAAKPKTKTKNKTSARKTSEPKRQIPAGYVDLGLPSGTLWKTTNEYGFYTYEQAVHKYGNKLPSKEQLQELIKNCTWDWDFSLKGYVVKGSSGNSIFLPTAGMRGNYGIVVGEGSSGFYWSYEPYGNTALGIHFSKEGNKSIGGFDRSNGQSVRLVYK